MPSSRSSTICARGFPRSSATRYSSCAWPTSSWTFAVSASFRRSVGARMIHSRSGSTPISSEFACISTKRSTAVRYSSGIQSVASTLPPDVTCCSNSSNRSSCERWSSLNGSRLRSCGRQDGVERERVGHRDASVSERTARSAYRSASWAGDAEPPGRYQVGMPLSAVSRNVAASDGIGQREGARSDAVGDRRPEARLVGVAAFEHGLAPLLGQVAPLVDEHRRLADVLGHHVHVGADEPGEEIVGIAGFGGRCVGGRFEARGDPIDDRPEHVLLRGDVGVQARAADIEHAGDVADARCRVALLAEELAGRILDGAAPGGLDQGTLLTNDR